MIYTTVTAICVVAWTPISVQAETDLPQLLDKLAQANEIDAKRLDRQIKSTWSKSGSASMDLLLRRGREALEAKQTQAAIEHFTALTDHAPQFAEGWHALARAYFAAELYGPTLHALGEALERNPDQYDALFGLGVLFRNFGDLRRAEQAFLQTLDLHPHHENAKQALEALQREGVGRRL
ncbi:MAG: tetratricopeptide repeat protein [Paracoccaceae bacterium]